MTKLNEILKIADIHVGRIKMAVDHLKDTFPLDEQKVVALNQDQLVYLDFLTFRFAKLQDLIGQKVIDEFLISKKEVIDGKTMIDKINKLERIGIISNAQVWEDLREARNHISHEYPDHPERIARYLNKIFDLIPTLLEILELIKTRS